MSRIVVASNRATLQAEDGASASGLPAALAAALRDYGGVWFGWSGRTTPEFTGQLSFERAAGIAVATVDLTPQDVEEYCNGFANKTLWPLCHHRLDLAAFERSFDQGYERVNAKFADTMMPLVEPGDLVWVHDYHLIPLGKELRRRGVANRIGFFLHIPWPEHQLITALPNHDALVRSLFEYDLVGFQTEDWLQAFNSYVLQEAGGEILPNGRVKAFGKIISVAAFPLGVDPTEIRALGASPSATKWGKRLRRSLAGRRLVASVDQVDYANGLSAKLSAYEQFLNDTPSWRERVQLLQVAASSPDGVHACQDMRSSLESLTGRINGAFGGVDWTPVRYVNRRQSRAELATIYRVASVGLVTPFRDGMNLVAKEFIAAQAADDPGVLVLSRFAGAARQMRDALIVNPYSREDVAEAIKLGLSMSLADRRKRWESLFNGLNSASLSHWRDAFVAALSASREAPAASSAA